MRLLLDWIKQAHRLYRSDTPLAYRMRAYSGATLSKVVEPTLAPTRSSIGAVRSSARTLQGCDSSLVGAALVDYHLSGYTVTVHRLVEKAPGCGRVTVCR
jgi:hypothetical protein